MTSVGHKDRPGAVALNTTVTADFFANLKGLMVRPLGVKKCRVSGRQIDADITMVNGVLLFVNQTFTQGQGAFKRFDRDLCALSPNWEPDDRHWRVALSSREGGR
ncbi:hypothetical protein AK51_23055 [Serratia nematodiphila DZ0503SBS1]|nr:hypothetical protein AK51_23055 [Serratia nematodiphila DZ0503SBS1]